MNWFQHKKIECRKLPLAEAASAGQTVVVIDVLRAFSAEAYAFARGVEEIIAVGTVEQALEWRRRDPTVLLMGEVNGQPIPGFDLWNSPAQIMRADLRGRRLVHRTTAGTQGVLACAGAQTLLVASLVCAGATAKYLQKLAPDRVDFIITGQSQHRDGDEDAACADYIATLLDGMVVIDAGLLLLRVHRSDAGQKFHREDPAQGWLEDLELCLQINRFDFAMRVSALEDGLHVRPVSGEHLPVQ